jgi:hypothetical protein
MSPSRLAGASLASLLLWGCDYGPAVHGGQPAIAHEVPANYSSGRSGNRSSTLAQVHYFEVSVENLQHPREVKAFFRFRCRETYLPLICKIDAWPIGMAPHHDRLSADDLDSIVATYHLDRRTNDEDFVLYPRSRKARRL